MTTPLAAEHLALDDLADLSVGELSPDAAAAAEAHLADCQACRQELDQLSAEMGQVGGELSGLLGVPGSAAAEAGATPDFLPPMPVTVAARLDRMLAAEAEARAAGPSAGSAGPAGSPAGKVVPFARSAPLRAPATASYVKQTGVVRIMLVAAVAAAVVGFGGYVVSATAGLNEPPPCPRAGAPGRPGVAGRAACREPGPGSAPVLGRLALRPQGDHGPDHRDHPRLRRRPAELPRLHPVRQRHVRDPGEQLRRPHPDRRASGASERVAPRNSRRAGHVGLPVGDDEQQ